MKILGVLSSILSPRKSEFTKRLVAKRLMCAKSSLISSIAIQGTAQYQMRKLGLESLEHSVTPEATIVNVLEKYWLPHVAGAYGNRLAKDSAPFPSHSSSQDAEKARDRIERLAGHLEYLLSGRPDAACQLPVLNSFVEYLRFRVSRDHPDNPHLQPEHGFTDEFFSYAIEESRLVFARS